LRFRTWAPLLAAALLAGCGARDAGEPAARPVKVRVASASAHDFAVTLHVSGRIAPPVDRQASVSAPVAGRVQEVLAREGQRVKKDEVLARVDTRPLDDALRSAEAALKRVEADAAFKRDVAKRSRELYDKGVVARQDAEADASAAVAADSAVVEATSNLSAARRNRGWADVAAPFDGVVVRILRHPGEQVDGTAATPIAEVAGLDPLEVALDVPPEALARLHAGDEAAVTAGGGAAIAARITRVAGSLDTASLVGGVRLRFAGASPPLALGTPVDVRLTLERLAGAVAVPKRAVRRSAEGAAEVVEVAGGKAKATPVTLGPEDGGLVAVRSGLKAGDVVVVEDPLGLADGTPLEIAR
jgi:RND family efflux transporter MFP subunit